MRLTLKPSLLAMMFILPSLSHAAFEFVPAGSSGAAGAGSSVLSNCREAVVVHENEDSRPGVDSPLRSVGYEKSLSVALRSVTPKGWKGHLVKDKRIDRGCLLDWSKNESWVEGLEDTLKGTGFIATLDWKKKRMALSAGTCGGRCIESDARSTAPAMQERVFVSGNTPQVWMVEAGGRLSDALSATAEQNGWSVSWELPYDFPVEMSIKLSGTVGQMMESLVHAYQDRGEMIGVTPVINEGSGQRMISIRVHNMGVPQ